MLFVTLAPCLLLFALTLRISIALRQAIIKRKTLCIPKKEKECLQNGGKKEKKEKDSDNNLVASTKYFHYILKFIKIIL